MERGGAAGPKHRPHLPCRVNSALRGVTIRSPASSPGQTAAGLRLRKCPRIPSTRHPLHPHTPSHTFSRPPRRATAYAAVFRVGRSPPSPAAAGLLGENSAVSRLRPVPAYGSSNGVPPVAARAGRQRPGGPLSRRFTPSAVLGPARCCGSCYCWAGARRGRQGRVGGGRSRRAGPRSGCALRWTADSPQIMGIPVHRCGPSAVER